MDFHGDDEKHSKEIVQIVNLVAAGISVPESLTVCRGLVAIVGARFGLRFGPA
jgi:hypothetical protein